MIEWLSGGRSLEEGVAGVGWASNWGRWTKPAESGQGCSLRWNIRGGNIRHTTRNAMHEPCQRPHPARGKFQDRNQSALKSTFWPDIAGARADFCSWSSWL